MFVPLGGAPKREDFVGLLLECHERIRRFAGLSRAIAQRTDLPVSEVVEACERCERYFSEALPRHVADEEESLLPHLRGHSPEVDAALATMHTQHEHHRPLLVELLTALGEVRHSPTDPAARERLAPLATRALRDFDEHLRLEEAILFPVVTATWTPQQSARAVEELRARRHAASPGFHSASSR